MSVATGGDLIDPGSLRARLAGRALGSAGFFPVWIVIVALFVVAAFVAPNTISDTSFSQIWPFATVLAVAALGEMLVVMTGGIDLSVPVGHHDGRNRPARRWSRARTTSS